MSYRDENTEAKVYVGDLPKDAEEKELERAFSYYGRLKSVWLARNPPGFAFIEFEDPKDAEDAVRGLDGNKICGAKARVEHATGKIRQKPWMRDGGGRGGGGRGGGYGADRYGGGGGGYGGGGGAGRRPADSSCYNCGERGHFSRDCTARRSGGGGGSYSGAGDRGSGGRSAARRRSPSRSRSRERKRSESRSVSRSRSREARPRYD